MGKTITIEIDDLADGLEDEPTSLHVDMGDGSVINLTGPDGDLEDKANDVGGASLREYLRTVRDAVLPLKRLQPPKELAKAWTPAQVDAAKAAGLLA